jgi:hypothetical protein
MFVDVMKLFRVRISRIGLRTPPVYLIAPKSERGIHREEESLEESDPFLPLSDLGAIR